ncbi:MAG: flagellar biosynthesis protein FlgH [Desulfurella sp.]|uniref:flagellar basal body L-ring protein FlgH n=1 Tax=Desulfurella sp. TaxID=1962857 RepID=UPI000CC8A637|nr:flagellar basal body L-ring protein FlgH [Desulfurella sp.]PMP89983.1 MAG: flagellar biosynthesis protein FlgH [Desulfurella sp.]
MKWKYLSFLSIAFMLASCSNAQIKSNYEKMPQYVKEQPSIEESNRTALGSLWSDSSSNLAGDIKASHVGDLVTVVVSEQIASQNTSQTQTSENSSTNSGLTTLLGLQNRIFSALNLANGGNNNLANFGGSNSYKGSGTNQSSNTLTATIEARIIKALPNNRFFIRGEKQVYTNGEENTVVLTGIISKYDISSSNTIDSNLISDAKIYYNGKGVVSDTHNIGWLAKLWQLIRPF